MNTVSAQAAPAILAPVAHWRVQPYLLPPATLWAGCNFHLIIKFLFTILGLGAFKFSWRYPCSEVAGSTDVKLIPEHLPARDAFTPKGKLTAHTSHFPLQNPILSPFNMSTRGAPATRQHPIQPPSRGDTQHVVGLTTQAGKSYQEAPRSFAPVTGCAGRDPRYSEL